MLRFEAKQYGGKIPNMFHLQHKLLNLSRYPKRCPVLNTNWYAPPHTSILYHVGGTQATVHEAADWRPYCDFGGQETGPLTGLNAHKVFRTAAKALPGNEHAKTLQDVTFEALTVLNVKTIVFWDATPSSFLWNVASFLPDYTESHPGRQYYSCLWFKHHPVVYTKHQQHQFTQHTTLTTECSNLCHSATYFGQSLWPPSGTDKIQVHKEICYRRDPLILY
jgi:hypothetical protein